MTDNKRLAATLQWYAAHTDGAQLRSVLIDAANALERCAGDTDVERLLQEVYL